MRTIDDITQGKPDELDKVLLKGALDFPFFCENILQNPEDHNKGLEIKDFHREWVENIRENNRVNIIAPRQHGKTMILGVAYPLWLAFYFKYKRILVVSSSMKSSMNVLSRIKDMIMDNEVLKRLIPTDRKISWSKTEIKTTTGSELFCKAYNPNIKGEKLDYILCDEVSEYIDHDIFYSVILPTTAFSRGTICTITTPKTKTDLSAELKENPNFISLTYSAIKDDGKPLWPEHYPLEYLDKLKSEMTAMKFQREFLCKITSAATQAFPWAIMEPALDQKETFEFKRRPENLNEYYLGCDFAVSAKGDYSVFTTVEKTNDKAFIRNIDRLRGIGVKAQIDKIVDLYERFGYTRLLVDESNIGMAFVEDLVKRGLPVQGMDFSYQKRNALLLHLIKAFENKQLMLPQNQTNPSTKGLIKVLLKELSDIVTGETKSGQFTYKSVGKHDDMVMSLGLACKAALDQRPFTVMLGLGKKGGGKRLVGGGGAQPFGPERKSYKKRNGQPQQQDIKAILRGDAQ